MLVSYSTTQSADFLRGRQLPEFVKLSNLQPHEKSRLFPDMSYALIVMGKEAGAAPERMFPIYDRAQTWLSAHDLEWNLEGMPKTAATIAARNIYGAATLFDVEIPPILKKLAAEVPPKTGRHYFLNPLEPVIRKEAFEKTASLATHEAITIGGTVRPIRNSMELNQAEGWFDDLVDGVPRHMKIAQADKYALARFIVSRREELAQPGEKVAFTLHVSDEITRVARLDSFNPHFKFAMLDRARKCLKGPVARDYAVLAANEKIAAVSGPLAMIDQVERLDATGEMRQYYGRTIPDAISCVLVHNKTAEEAEVEREKTATVKIGGMMGVGGHEFSLGEVRNAIKSGQVAKKLGAAMAEKLARDPETGLAQLDDYFGDMIAADVMRARSGR